FLRVLRLRRVAARLVRQVLLAVALRDHVADLGERLVRERDRVRAHVRDQADRAFADLDAFVQPLRDRHRALRAEAELPGRFLLQRRGRERRGRIAAPLLAVDLRDDQRAGGLRTDRLLGRADVALVRERELL